MTDRPGWRRVLAALLGAVSVIAAVVGAVQATGADPPPAPAAGAALPSLPPLDGLPAPGATSGVPAFAPSALVPVPVAGPVAPTGPRRPAGGPGRVEPDRAGDSGRTPTAPGTTRTPHRVGSGYDPADPRYQGADDPGTAAGRAPTSGETQREWVCRQDPSPAGC